MLDSDYTDEYELNDDPTPIDDTIDDSGPLLTFVRKKKVIDIDQDVEDVVDEIPPGLEAIDNNKQDQHDDHEASSVVSTPFVTQSANDVDAIRRIIRYKSLQSNRDLPIYQQRDEIITSINHHTVSVIHCETGSGKSTQVPQYCLYTTPILDMVQSKGSPSIWMSVPRKLSSLSLSQRIYDELTFFQSEVRDIYQHHMDDNSRIQGEADHETPPGVIPSGVGVNTNVIDFPHHIKTQTPAYHQQVISVINHSKVYHSIYEAKQSTRGKDRDPPSVSITITTDNDITRELARYIRILRDVLTSRRQRHNDHHHRHQPQQEQSGKNVDDIPPPPFSVLIIDEIHERTLYTDILLSLSMELIQLYTLAMQPPGHSVTSPTTTLSFPFRIVIMSATMDVTMISSFIQPYTTSLNLIQSTVKTYPVEVVYSKALNYDYIHASAEQCFHIHMKYPRGNILVFLPTRDDLQACEQKLLELIQQAMDDGCSVIQNEEYDQLLHDLSSKDMHDTSHLHHDDDTPNDDLSEQQQPEDMLTLPPTKIYDIATVQISSAHRNTTKLFAPTDNITRKVIFSTSVCETSLTVPGVTYVIDSGYTQTTVLTSTALAQSSTNLPASYYPFPTLNQFETITTTVSQHQAIQRAGRAGRTRPGICFRLYTEEIFQSLNVASIPEIHRTNLFVVCFLLLALDIPLPFLSFYEPPQHDDVLLALQWLRVMDLIDDSGRITLFGIAVHSLSHRLKVGLQHHQYRSNTTHAPGSIRRQPPSSSADHVEIRVINYARLLLTSHVMGCLEPMTWLVAHLEHLLQQQVNPHHHHHDPLILPSSTGDPSSDSIVSHQGEISTLLVAISSILSPSQGITREVLPSVNFPYLATLRHQSQLIQQMFTSWEHYFIRMIPRHIDTMTTSRTITRRVIRSPQDYHQHLETYFLPFSSSRRDRGEHLSVVDRIHYCWAATYFYNSVILVDSVFKHLFPQLRTTPVGSTSRPTRGGLISPISKRFAKSITAHPSDYNSRTYVYGDLTQHGKMVMVEEVSYNMIRPIIKEVPTLRSTDNLFAQMIRVHQRLRDDLGLAPTPLQLASLRGDQPQHHKGAVPLIFGSTIDSKSGNSLPTSNQWGLNDPQWIQKLQDARVRYKERRSKS